jgi:cytochrome c oxidase subunit IV
MSDTATHSHNKKQYWIIFFFLFVLTILEVALAQPSLGVPKVPMVIGLVTLALTKAALVGLFFMHLRTEMKALKLTVALPFAFPALYAFVLIAEAGWRYLR